MVRDNSIIEGSLDISGCNADMIPYVNFQIIGKTVEERPDLDGENRDIAVEVVLDMDVKHMRSVRRML